MSPCPDEAALAAATTAGLSEALEAHLDGCAACRQVFAAAVGEGGPSTLGRYELGALIGAGGMGVVYAAYDPKLGRTVALKMLRGQDEAGRERFLREARVMAKLAHPSVVNVFDLGELDERVFIAMEHVEGGTLRRWLASPRTVPEIIQRFTQAGEGLAAAHRAGVVHRDFKPENVLLGADGRARVTDFGLANQAPGEALPSEVAVTSTGLHGTPAYMSPEQLRGERVDARTDQFAFCVALYEALAGRRPWAGKTVQALRDELETVMPSRPKRDGVPAHVWRAIERGLSRDVEARFPSIDALLFALTHAPRRWPGAVAGIVVLVLLAIIALPFVEGPTPTPAVLPMPPAPPRAVVPPKTEMDVLVEPGEAEPLPPAGVEVFLAPGTTRDFRVNATLRVVKVEDPAVLDVDPTPEELTLAGLEVGRTTLTLDFGRERRSWPVTVRKPVALFPCWWASASTSSWRASRGCRSATRSSSSSSARRRACASSPGAPA